MTKHSDVWSISSSEPPRYPQHEKKYVNSKGYSWFLAAVFIVADMMGAGMVSLPVAIGQSGAIAGVIILILGAIFSAYTGIQLSDNWTIMQKRWPEYREHCRRPYPEMARRALGAWAKIPTDICLAATLYSSATVLTLFAAQNIQLLLASLFSFHVNLCILILAVGLILLPFTWLKSPMHFWWAGCVAAATSFIAAVLIVAGSIHDAPTCRPVVDFPKTTTQTISMAYGTMVFAYGGHSAFPTIQHDMKRPSRFKRAVLFSYIFILIVYLSVSLVGFEIYGASVRDSIIPSIQVKWISQTINILITIHVLPAILIFLSPLCQQVEELIHVSKDFGVGRVITRTSILVFCIFTAETVPDFGVVLDLVGGTTITMMTMILPSIFWLFLKSSDKRNKDQEKTLVNPDKIPSLLDVWKYTSKPFFFFTMISLLFGLTGGIMATYSAIQAMISPDSSISPPCYVEWFKGTLKPPNSGTVHCCGIWKNVSIYGDDAHCSLVA